MKKEIEFLEEMKDKIVYVENELIHHLLDERLEKLKQQDEDEKRPGFYKKQLKIKFLYRGEWYYASSLDIDRDGIIDIEYGHDLEGCVDEEHVQMIEVEDKGGSI